MAKQIEKSSIKIQIKTGSQRDLLVTWKFSHSPESEIASYDWVYEVLLVNDKTWVPGGTGQSTASGDSAPLKSAEFTAPDNAKKIRFKVRPNSKKKSDDKTDRSGVVADSDTKESYYFQGSWSDWQPFSNWLKVKNPPALKVDGIKIKKEPASGGGYDLVARYDVNAKKYASLLPYLSGFEYKWEGWNGRDWGDLSGSVDGAIYRVINDEQIIPEHQANGTIEFNQRVRTEIGKNGKTLTFYHKIHLQASYKTYRFTIAPTVTNEYYVLPVENIITKNVTAETKQLTEKQISVKTRTENNNFYVYWYTTDKTWFMDPETETNIISGFQVSWRYAKPTNSIFNRDSSIGDYWENGAVEETVDVIDRVEYEIETMPSETTEFYVENKSKAKQKKVCPKGALAAKTSSNVHDLAWITDETAALAFVSANFGTGLQNVDVEKVTIYQWVYSFALPDGINPATEAEVRIKPVPADTDMFKGEWSNWVLCKKSISSVKGADYVHFAAYPGNARKFDILFTKFDLTNISGFEYIFYYQLATDSYWRVASSGSVDLTDTLNGYAKIEDIRNTNAGFVPADIIYADYDTIVARTDFYKWLLTLEAPAEAVAVEIEILPTPSFDGAFVPYPTREHSDILIPVKVVDHGSITIRVLDATNRSLIANWTPLTDSDVQSYECVWEYYYLGMWMNGQSNTYSQGTIMNLSGNTVTTPTSTYSGVPENATEVRFAVRPVASSENVFKGGWENFVYFPIRPASIKLTSAYIRRDEKTARGLVGGITNLAEIPPEVKNLVFEWSYWRLGVWRGEETTVDVKFPNADFDIPEDADTIRLRVKPDIEDITYKGEWSDYVSYNATIPIKMVEEGSINVRPFRGSDRSLIASWGVGSWNTIENFTVQWKYYLNGYWFTDKEEDISKEDCNSIYQVPERSYMAAFRVMPNPIYEADFKGEWCSWVYLEVADDTTPAIPSVPKVEVKKNTFDFTATVDTYDKNTVSIEFEVIDRSRGEVCDYGISEVQFNRATFQFTGFFGRSYAVRARGINADGLTMEDIGETGETGWSEYSSDVHARPAQVTLVRITALTASSIQLEWAYKSLYSSTDITQFEIQYTDKERYFDTNPNAVTSTTVDYSDHPMLILTDLEAKDYYFRVRAVNDSGNGDWSEVVYGTCGKRPNAPTTWSSRLNGTVGSDIYLYWTHNAEDGSAEKLAEVEITVNGVSTTVELPKDEESTEQSSYKLPDDMTENAGTIEWRVRTKGVHPDMSPWSTQRIIKIFSPPAINVTLAGSNTWTWDDFVFNEDNIYSADGSLGRLINNTVTSFPILVGLEAGPASQTPVAYVITIASNSNYETTDVHGNATQVVKGQRVFNRILNTNKNSFVTLINPGDVNLENGMSYELTATVAMDSGLTAERKVSFTVSWDDDEHEIDAEIGFDFARFIAYVTPRCTDSDGSLSSNVTMAVYRREFDGGFTLIADNISNIEQPTITDPHPNLDYARYRVTARSNSTGKVEFYDIPGFPVHEYGIILQWDESQISYNSLNRDEHDTFTRAGSMIRLPFNVDTTDSNQVDVEMVEYIGRSHPVSYFGTQVGQKATWTAVIPKTDTQTIYDLRRLARYMGNVYVREPSGTGYWAHVEVSFNLTHLETTVPVNLSITRVEGGM